MAKTKSRYQGEFARMRLAKSRPGWIALEWIDERSDKDTSWVAVTLNLNGEVVTALSPALPKNQCRHGVARTALATLKGIELLVHHQFACELLDAGVVHALGAVLVMVRVRLKLGNEAIELFGSARVEGDFLAATANAALDATNLYIDYTLSFHE